MNRRQGELHGETVERAECPGIGCAHRKLITRVNSEGRHFVRCLDCKLEGASHQTVTDAFLHRREDLEDAAALRTVTHDKERPKA